MGRELRVSFRSLRQSPGFAIMSIVVLALAIGAATATFNLIDQLLLQPLPYREPSRVVLIWPKLDGDRSRFTAHEFLELQKNTKSFDTLAAIGAARLDLTGSGEPEALGGARVTGGYFEALGIHPLYGRAITNADIADDADVVVLGNELWRRRFGASASIIGKAIRLDDRSRVVIGVLPPGPFPMNATTSGRDVFSSSMQDFLIPAHFNPKYLRYAGVLVLAGRLRPGVTTSAAAAECGAILESLHSSEPAAEVVSVDRELKGDVRTPLLLLAATIALVLLIAAANVTALFLVRGIGRMRTLAVMLANGASRGRIALRVVADVVWIAAAAGVAGILLSRLFIRVIVSVVPSEIPRLASISLDAHTLIVALGLTCLVMMICGGVAGFHAAASASTAALSSGTRASGGARSRITRRALAVAQIALAVVLAIASGLLMSAYRRAFAADRGFNAAHVVMADLSLPPARYGKAYQVTAFTDHLLTESRRLPGVTAATVSYQRPLHGDWINSFEIVGRQSEATPTGRFCPVTPGFFQTLGIELLRGRTFSSGDQPGSIGAVIVNETLVKRYFADIDPLGKHLRISPPSSIWGAEMPEEFEIVGVVEDVRLLAKNIDRDAMFFIPWSQGPLTDLSLIVRTKNEVAFERALPAIVHGIDPSLPVDQPTTVEQQIETRLGQPRFTAIVVSFFGIIALLLAMTGVYGLLAENVLQQTRALGIRIAFGARAVDVFRLIVSEGLVLLGAGIVAGTLASIGAAYALRHLILGVDLKDVAAYGEVSVALLFATLAACVAPALRAARIDPASALRHD